MSNGSPRDWWSKVRDGATALAAVAVPIVVAILGNQINVSLKDRDVRLKTVELAISILKDDPKKNPESPVLRSWAMNVIDQFSGIPLPESAREELQKNPIVHSSVVATCSNFPASVVAGNSHTISITETASGCHISIDGATEVDTALKCSNFPVVIYSKSTVSKSEDPRECRFAVE